MGDSPFILKDGVQPTLCRWVFEINFQKTPTSILKSCLLWRLQCLWGTANHDSEPPWSIGAPRHVSLGGQPPASNQFSFCRTKNTCCIWKGPWKITKKWCQDSSFQMLSQTPWWTDSEPDELAPIITEVLRDFGEMWWRLGSFTKDFGIISRTSWSLNLYWCFMKVIHIHRLIQYWWVFSLNSFMV